LYYFAHSCVRVFNGQRPESNKKMGGIKILRGQGKILKGSSRPHGTTTLVDNKTFCNPKNYEGLNPSGATNKRDQKLYAGYMSAAKELDKNYHGAQDGQENPAEESVLSNTNTAAPEKSTPLCLAPSETHLKESKTCAVLQRVHSHTGTCNGFCGLWVAGFVLVRVRQAHPTALYYYFTWVLQATHRPTHANAF